MSKISLFFSLIKDESWHNIKDLSKALNVPTNRLSQALKFLAEHNIIEYKQDKEQIRINPKWRILCDENQQTEEEKSAIGTLIIPPKNSINIQCTKITNLTDNPVELDIRTNKQLREIIINRINF